MSTRAGIIITDGERELHFYRHSDGYPEGTMPTLNIFMDWVKKGIIRDNVDQAAGWLIIIGAMSYNTIPAFQTTKPTFKGGKSRGDYNTIQEPQGWKCGAYEPTTSVDDHGDLEYIYTVNLQTKTITHK